jgi:dihydrofolate reductase
MGSVMGESFSWLFGHRSYDDLLGHWNEVGGPFKAGLNGTMKYVASSDPDATLPWPNSSLLSGDIPAAVADLRRRSAGNLVIMGSGELICSLLPHDLIDELLLVIHPVTLGSGRRLFPEDGALRRFDLVSAEATDAGLVLARYRRG